MKALKYLIAIAFIFITFISCKKELNEDLSLVSTGVVPSKLAALFTITQNNSGLVTILPNGEAGAYYEIYFGDGTVAPAIVNAGKAATHTYGEGIFNVRMVAHDVTGKTTELTKQLTVTFRAPENLVVTITKDPLNNLKINVSATAIYETFFKIYYGDVTNEIPVQFNEGTTVSHTYTTAGTYTVKVIAFSGGAATTTYTQVITVAKQIDLPVTFDDPIYDYTMTDFGGNISVDAFDPLVPTNKVKKVTKPNGAETYAGTTIGTPLGFASLIPITSTTTQMSVRVYSPAAGLKLRMKIEDHTDPTKSVETDKLTTVANAWETIIFDFANQATNTAILNPSYHFDKATIFFDFGNAGTGKIFYFDDVKYLAVNVAPTGLVLPIDFQSTTPNFYKFSDFGGATSSVVNNPSISGINISTKVGSTIKPNGVPNYAASFLELANPINFSTSNTIKIKVYSPEANIKVKLKLENLANGNINTEQDAFTTVANSWEELTYTFTGIVNSNNYQRVVVFFDFDNAGKGLTYYFDDIRLVTVAPGLALPIDFESTTPNFYKFSDFGGATSSVVNNPSISGINTSTKVGSTIKPNGVPNYAASFLELANPINFSTSNTIKIKVYSPEANIKVKLKLENFANGNINTEQDAFTTVANSWEELTYTFTGIVNSNNYQRVVVFFDFDNAGKGLTYYFDDIKLN